MSKLTSAEQGIIARIQTDYESLSADAQAEVAKGVSWAERHIGIAVAVTLFVGLMLGVWAGYSF